MFSRWVFWREYCFHYVREEAIIISIKWIQPSSLVWVGGGLSPRSNGCDVAHGSWCCRYYVHFLSVGSLVKGAEEARMVFDVCVWWVDKKMHGGVRMWYVIMCQLVVGTCSYLAWRCQVSLLVPTYMWLIGFLPWCQLFVPVPMYMWWIFGGVNWCSIFECRRTNSYVGAGRRCFRSFGGVKEVQYLGRQVGLWVPSREGKMSPRNHYLERCVSMAFIVNC